MSHNITVRGAVSVGSVKPPKWEMKNLPSPPRRRDETRGASGRQKSYSSFRNTDPPEHDEPDDPGPRGLCLRLGEPAPGVFTPVPAEESRRRGSRSKGPRTRGFPRGLRGFFLLLPPYGGPGAAGDRDRPGERPVPDDRDPVSRRGADREQPAPVPNHAAPGRDPVPGSPGVRRNLRHEFGDERGGPVGVADERNCRRVAHRRILLPVLFPDQPEAVETHERALELFQDCRLRASGHWRGLRAQKPARRNGRLYQRARTGGGPDRRERPGERGPRGPPGTSQTGRAS